MLGIRIGISLFCWNWEAVDAGSQGIISHVEAASASVTAEKSPMKVIPGIVCVEREVQARRSENLGKCVCMVTSCSIACGRKVAAAAQRARLLFPPRTLIDIFSLLVALSSGWRRR